MLEMIDKIDVSVPTEYISEVVPIRYAKVDEIASALQSLGGSGAATVSIGGSSGGGQISGLAGARSSGSSGLSGLSGSGYASGGGGGGSSSGISGSTPFGGSRSSGTTANGTPTPGGTFQSRLNNILNQSGGGGGSGGKQQDIQLFGQTKIIPNESSSTLLIYATRQDLDAITNIIAKLDVPLAQVLIEAAIIDVTLGNTFNFGVSASQTRRASAATISAVAA